jgi:hypothetical protein
MKKTHYHPESRAKGIIFFIILPFSITPLFLKGTGFNKIVIVVQKGIFILFCIPYKRRKRGFTKQGFYMQEKKG